MRIGRCIAVRAPLQQGTDRHVRVLLPEEHLGNRKIGLLRATVHHPPTTDLVLREGMWAFNKHLMRTQCSPADWNWSKTGFTSVRTLPQSFPPNAYCGWSSACDLEVCWIVSCTQLEKWDHRRVQFACRKCAGTFPKCQVSGFDQKSQNRNRTKGVRNFPTLSDPAALLIGFDVLRAGTKKWAQRSFCSSLFSWFAPVWLSQPSLSVAHGRCSSAVIPRKFAPESETLKRFPHLNGSLHHAREGKAAKAALAFSIAVQDVKSVCHCVSTQSSPCLLIPTKDPQNVAPRDGPTFLQMNSNNYFGNGLCRQRVWDERLGRWHSRKTSDRPAVRCRSRRICTENVQLQDRNKLCRFLEASKPRTHVHCAGFFVSVRTRVAR